jgi:predicted dehydrogenase
MIIGPNDPRSGVSRRSFLRTSALGLTVSPFIRWDSFKDVPEDEKLGVALVGMGNYASRQLAPALEETKLCRLAAIVTGTPSKAESWLQSHPHLEGHIYDYDTFEKMADDDSIDIVYVVLPNSMHAEFTIRAAKIGKHVICEKPMAVSVAESEAMIAACDEAGKKLSIGYRLHFEPFNLEAKRLGQEQVFGKVKHVHTSFGFRLRNSNQWRLKKDLAGGGALMDVGIYAIQSARYVTGEEPLSVTAQEVKTDLVKFSEVDETITWQLKFPSGCIATSATSYASRMGRLFASAENGWFELRPAYIYGGVAGTTSEGPMDFPDVYEQTLQMDDFADCILNDRTSSVDGYEGLRDMRIIEAIYEGIRTGAAVEVSG